jgi:hypothetical protein
VVLVVVLVVVGVVLVVVAGPVVVHTWNFSQLSPFP